MTEIREDYEIDHRTMAPPFIRVTRVTGPVTEWDLRLTQPGLGRVDDAVSHSLEHMLTVYMRKRSQQVVRVTKMGCKTGFNIFTHGELNDTTMRQLLADALMDVQTADTVVLADRQHCGSPEMHTLEGAQAAADMLLRQHAGWGVCQFTDSAPDPADAAYAGPPDAPSQKETPA